MSGISELGRDAWTARDTIRCIRLMAFLLRVCVAALLGAALGWGLKGGWTDAAAWWHWVVIGASAAAIWAVYRGTFFTLRGPIEVSLGSGVGAAFFVLLGAIAPRSPALPQIVLAYAVLAAGVAWITYALFDLRRQRRDVRRAGAPAGNREDEGGAL